MYRPVEKRNHHAPPYVSSAGRREWCRTRQDDSCCCCWASFASVIIWSVCYSSYEPGPSVGNSNFSTSCGTAKSVLGRPTHMVNVALSWQSCLNSGQAGRQRGATDRLMYGITEWNVDATPPL